MARAKNLSGIIRGDARLVTVTVATAANKPVDITGSRMFLTVNANNDPTTDVGAIIEQSWSPVYTIYNGVVYDPVKGQACFLLTNAMMQNLTPGNYYYDVQMVDAAGNPTSTPQAQFTVSADITRRVTG